MLSVRWPTGYMDLIVKNFFPCPLNKFKKLLKLIELDSNQDEIKEDLRCYFMERWNYCKQAISEHTQDWRIHHQMAVDYGEMVKTRKFPVGTRLNQVQWDHAREKLKEYQKAEKQALKDYKTEKANLAKFERLLLAIK